MALGLNRMSLRLESIWVCFISRFAIASILFIILCFEKGLEILIHNHNQPFIIGRS